MIKKSTNAILHGPLASTLLKFIVPILLSNVIQQLYITTDRIIVGRFVGKEGFAAIGVSFPIIFLLATALIGIFIGSSIFLAHALGAHKHQRARHIVDNCYILMIGISIIIMLIGAVAAPWFIKVLRVPELIRDDAINYLSIFFWGFPSLSFYYGTSSLSRASGNSKTPLYFFALAAVGNVFLDLIFIIWFGWGVAGSAWATIIMQSLAGFLQLIYFYHKNPLLRLRSRLQFDFSIIKNITRLGSLGTLQQITVACNMLILQLFVNGYDFIIISGYVAGNQVDTYGRVTMLSTMIGLSPFVSQNLGAGQEDRARKALWVALLFNIIVSFFFFFFVTFWGESIVSLFNKDAQMIAIGVEYLKVESAFYWLLSLQFCFVGFLRGAGAALFPALIALLMSCALPLFAFVYGHFFGHQGLWFSFPTVWGFLAVIYFIYYASGKWRGKISHSKK